MEHRFIRLQVRGESHWFNPDLVKYFTADRDGQSAERTRLVFSDGTYIAVDGPPAEVARYLTGRSETKAPN